MRCSIRIKIQITLNQQGKALFAPLTRTVRGLMKSQHSRDPHSLPPACAIVITKLTTRLEAAIMWRLSLTAWTHINRPQGLPNRQFAKVVAHKSEMQADQAILHLELLMLSKIVMVSEATATTWIGRLWASFQPARALDHPYVRNHPLSSNPPSKAELPCIMSQMLHKIRMSRECARAVIESLPF